MFDEALRSRLLVDSALAALIGTRVTWTIRPQGAPYPAVVLSLISDGRPQRMKGFQALRDTRVQIDCYAETALSKLAVREAVIAAIAPAAVVAGTTFARCFIEAVRDRGDDSTTQFIHRDSIDATFWHD